MKEIYKKLTYAVVWTKGVAERRKETNTHIFFFGALSDPLPPSTFLIEYVFSTDMFSVIFYFQNFKIFEIQVVQ